MTLYASKTDRPWSTVNPDDGPACSHMCPEHPPARHQGAKLTLAELDQRARELGYSPGPGITVRQEWLAGRQAEVPAYLLGPHAAEVFDPSPAKVAARARRLWLDLSDRLPENAGPATLVDHHPEIRGLADLIASLDVLTPQALEELMAQ